MSLHSSIQVEVIFPTQTMTNFHGKGREREGEKEDKEEKKEKREKNKGVWLVMKSFRLIFSRRREFKSREEQEPLPLHFWSSQSGTFPLVGIIGSGCQNYGI